MKSEQAAGKAASVPATQPAQPTPLSVGAQDPKVPVANPAFFEASAGMGTGHENVTARDIIIPRLVILQGLSPQVTQGKAEFDPEARVGQIYDVGFKERFPDGIQLLIAKYERQWIEWAPRNSGRGIQRIHETDLVLNETQPNEKKIPTLKNGNHIIETAQFYGFNITAGVRPSFLPMASTQLKKAKYLISLSTSERVEFNGQEITPQFWYRLYNFSSVPESNNEGNWMGWKIERGPRLEDLRNWRDILARVKAFREQINRGEARGDLNDEGAAQTIDHSDASAM